MLLMKDKDTETEMNKSQPTQYDVYIYHRPANTNEQVQDWEILAEFGEELQPMMRQFLAERG